MKKQNISVILTFFLASCVIALSQKTLPETPPDFSHIATRVSEILATDEYKDVLELQKITNKTWLAQVWIIDKAPLSVSWKKTESLDKRFKAEFQHPSRIAGLVPDTNDVRRKVGSIIEIGYSTEVGYEGGNEFYEANEAFFKKLMEDEENNLKILSEKEKHRK